LNCYLDRKGSFRNAKVKKKTLWAQILKIMKENGYANLNEDLLDRKMRNMKKSYKNIKENNKKTSTGRGRVSWEYFDTFEEIFANDVTINCCPTLSSIQRSEMTGSESSQDEHEVIALTRFLSNSSNNTHYIPNSLPSISPFQPIHPASSGSSLIDDSNSLLSPSVTPTSERSEKATQMSTLHNMRKKQLDVEEKRIKAIMELKTSIDKNNNIQQERNNLLRDLLLLRTSQVEAEKNT